MILKEDVQQAILIPMHRAICFDTIASNTGLKKSSNINNNN